MDSEHYNNLIISISVKAVKLVDLSKSNSINLKQKKFKFLPKLQLLLSINVNGFWNLINFRYQTFSAFPNFF